MSNSLDNFIRDALQELDGVDSSVMPTDVVAKTDAGASSSMGVLPGHAVEGLIARGGMGLVYRARQTTLEREVAVKVMTSLADSPEMAARFRREALVLGKLAHPNIVPVYDIGTDDDGQLFYTMKLVKGITLQAIIIDLRNQEPETMKLHSLVSLLTIFRKVCDAMAFAHSQGVLHRDLKPENIMVGEFGEVLVMDWGLAKLIADSGEIMVDSQAPGLSSLSSIGHPLSATLQGSVLGTPQYMSPEQARGEIAELDARSDIFSLGSILYAILTLHPPVEGKTLNEVLEKVRTASITSPLSTGQGVTASSRQPGKTAGSPHSLTVPRALSSVAMKALQLDKTRRYQTVAALSADIEAYQGGFATSAEEAGAFKQLKLLMLRHKAVTASLAALLLISVGFVLKVIASERKATRNAVIATANESRANQNAEESRRSLAKAQVALAEAAFRRADLAGMLGELEACPADLRDQNWNYWWAKRDSSLGHLEIEGFTDPTDLSAVPGQPGVFALANEAGQIGFVNVAERKLLRTIDTGYAGLLQFCFSGDGRRLLALKVGASVAHLFDTGTGEQVAQFAVPADDQLVDKWDRRLALDHTGTRASIINVKRGQLSVVNTASGAVLWTTQSGDGRALFLPDDSRLAMINPRRRVFALFDAASGQVIRSTELFVESVAIRPDGNLLALGLQNGEAALMDAKTGIELRRGQLHTNAVSGVAWSADGQLLTMGGEGRLGSNKLALRVWKAADFAPRGLLFGAGNRSAFLQWTLEPASAYLLTLQSPPQLWHIPIGVELFHSEPDKEQGWSCSFVSDTLLLARYKYTVAGYDVTDPRKPVVVIPPFPSGWSMSAANAEHHVYAVAQRTGAKPWRMKIVSHEEEGEVERCRMQMPERAFHMDFDATAGRILMASKYAVQVHDTGTGEMRAMLKRTVDDAVFAGTQDGVIVIEPVHPGDVTASESRVVLLDGTTGETRATFASPTKLNALAGSPDRRLVAVAGDDQIVIVLDADTLTERFRFRAHDAAITALKFHPKLPILATGGMDYSIKLWDYTTGQMLQSFLGINGRPVMLSFNPKGTLLAAEGQEEVFRIYDVSEKSRDKAQR